MYKPRRFDEDDDLRRHFPISVTDVRKGRAVASRFRALLTSLDGPSYGQNGEWTGR